MPNKTTLIDVCLFSASVYVIYYHGKDIARYFENMCPTEQGILDMMKREQGGMMPPPMWLQTLTDHHLKFNLLD